MNRRKPLLIFCVIMLTALLVYGTASVINAGKVEVINAKFKITPENNMENLYMIKEYQGNIGVYLKSGNEYILSKVLHSKVLSLPNADKEALEEGIYISDKEALLMLLEDYAD